MESMMRIAGNVALLIFLGEMLLCLLPAGNMRQFCKFTLSIVLTISVFGAILQLGAVDLPEISAEQSNVQTSSYEDVILDVYNRYFENKNK